MSYDVYIVQDGEWFIADVPALPGCMSQGRTEEEAIKNIKDAINGYLCVVKKHNIKLPDPKVIRIAA